MTHADEEPVVHILWMNGGLGCDGDSVALTAATQPSIEEIVLGALPGLPKVAVHWPLIDFECGPEQGADNVHRVVAQGRPGRARALRARRRGVHPQRGDQVGRLLVRLRQQPGDGPADDHERVAGPARAQGHRDPGRRHLRHLRRHPRDGGQPDRRDGRARLPGLGLEVQGRPADRLRARLPDPPGQPVGDDPVPALPGGGAGADDPARRGPAAALAVRGHRAPGVRPGRLLRGRRVRQRVRHPGVPGQAGLLGAGRQVQRPQARLDQRGRRLPQRGRHLHRLHHARLPGQVHAVHGRAARRPRVEHGQRRCTAPSSARCAASPRARRTRNRSGGPRGPNCSPATRKRGDLR